MRAFSQVDVFTAVPYAGNPVAVVHDADGLTGADMQRFAHWTNLSETTFLLPPTDPAADYRVRIFTPATELPFAGHPTIGTCHAWLEAGGVPKTEGLVMQECGVGLVRLRRTDDRLAFAAPPLIKGGPATEADLEPVCAVLQIDRDAIIDAQWCDNGPGWIAVRLADADAVLALEPDFGALDDYDIGVVARNKIGAVGLTAGSVGDDPVRTTGGQPRMPTGSVGDVTVRAFFRTGGSQAAEDPVTGSLNAALAQWLLGAGELEAPYVASQGTALGRDGRVHIDQADGEIWVGGDAVTCVRGTVAV